MSEMNDAFRDSIGTVTTEGKRNWIFPKRPKGRFYNARTIVTVLYLIVFFTLPWIKVNGEPLFLFNILEQKFILFGQIFWPQDFFIFGFAMLTFLVFIVLFTVVFGRVFCGWICPQTIFMEMVFRKIEYWIEGDADKQRALSKMPWNQEKIAKRSIKFIVFFSLSFIIANYFLAYLVGMDRVMLYVREGIFLHLSVFIPLVMFAGVFFFVFWWFREQACIIVCPYGRLQGVMLDTNSIVVAYDYVRGEPRSKFKKHRDEEEQVGDCVDCFECVKVCPTGIDIRNGTQLECVNCTACIDACDAIMTKFNRPIGLIKYASESNIAKGEKTKFTIRTKAYTAVLVLLLVILGVLLFSRKDIQTNVMRAQGMLYQEQPNNQISNIYNITMVNKTRKDIPITLKLEDPEIKGTVKVMGKNLVLPKEAMGNGIFIIYIDRDKLKKRNNKIKIGVYSGSEKIDVVKTTFLAPGR